MDLPLTLPTHLLITGFILALLTLAFIFWFSIPALKLRQQLRKVLQALKGSNLEEQRAPHVLDPAKEDQATDRAWRIGQKKDVFVYYPVVAADDFTTFDVKLDQLLERKRSLAGDMLNGSPDINTTEFTLPDIVPTGMAQGIDEVVTLDIAMRMDWRYFEALAAAIWSRLGYGFVYCTPASNDHGVDVVAIQGNRGVLIQTKTSATDGLRLGWNAVRDVVAGEAFYEQKHSGVTFDKVGLTNQFFNSDAFAQADLNDVELFDRTRLTQLLSQFQVTMLDVERLLFQ